MGKGLVSREFRGLPRILIDKIQKSTAFLFLLQFTFIKLNLIFLFHRRFCEQTVSSFFYRIRLISLHKTYKSADRKSAASDTHYTISGAESVLGYTVLYIK